MFDFTYILKFLVNPKKKVDDLEDFQQKLGANRGNSSHTAQLIRHDQHALGGLLHPFRLPTQLYPSLALLQVS